MITVPNDEIVVLFQYENTVVPLQDTYTVHSKVDSAAEVSLKILNHKFLDGSNRERKSATAHDYIAFLQEHEFDIGLEDDHTSLNEAKLNIYSTQW